MNNSTLLKKLDSELQSNNQNLENLVELIFKLQEQGENKFEYQRLYILMIDFINNNIECKSKIEIKNDILDLILDIFWHQENGLKKLNKKEQIEFNKALIKVSKYDYRESEYSERLFYSISKSMDLIKYQKEYGDSEKLINLYLNHFNLVIKERAKEYSEKNWL
ncbi:hypothetical protein PG913_08590 [Tenacibaculum pacificus]|uniref:hypothetical protein n=1 Tax=Tenacibaculum TaxID=104267 RepID=UPI001E6078DA|nr:MULTISPECIES: hypothetical protein [Tenacibaculum]MCD8403835.1 hypothetical protein [Tenacibaculum finnmarkense genomovar finnmarkense]MCG8838965.1 hypothetical protein [Tenacibaculum dicentrarchi]WBX72956.1 hypothetical protein PG913_08590 [Tenacibaculum pacificus]